MKYRFQLQGRLLEITLDRHDGRSRATLDGVAYDFEVLDDQPGALTLRLEGRPLTLYWALDPAAGGRKWISSAGCSYLLEKPQAGAPRRSSSEHAGDSLRAPMPAQVRAIEVQAGQEIQKGQSLLILEAMKMEIRLSAPHAGRVTRLLVETGQQVNRDQVLLEIEEV